jgi:formylglycine-generating enzyme required for sulfatase activity
MKMNRQFSILSVAVAFSLSLCSGRSQDTVASDDQTNAIPLKNLMTTNNVVTNTVGVVLLKISQNLWVGKYELTQDAYQKMMRKNPSAFVSKQRPVDSVSWNDAVDFCSQLTAKEQLAKELPDGWGYTLPTEAQWEMLATDATLPDAVMILNNNSVKSTAPVGTSSPNHFGLYDLRGNVWEWCLDSNDPGRYKVLRGGGWDTFLEPNSRMDFRNYGSPDDKKNAYGFRVVLEPVSVAPK